MFRRFAAKLLNALAILVCLIALAVSALIIIRWATRPSPNSAEDLLARADRFAWNNDWVRANPLYVRAEQLFQSKSDPRNALYAHVSQFALMMESHDLPTLIAELRDDLSRPAASDLRVRLRILEMKAKCEEEYNASLAIQTYAQVEKLAIQQYKPYLASRASGEQGVLDFVMGNLAEAASRVKRAYVIAKYFGDPAAHVRYAEMIGAGIERLGRPRQALPFLDEAIRAQERHPEVALPFVAYSAKMDALTSLGRYQDALALADRAMIRPGKYHFYGQLQSLLTSRADVLMAEGKADDAIPEYQTALSYAKKLEDWRAITDIDAKLAAAFERVSAPEKALSTINDAIQANEQTPQELFLVPGNLALKAELETQLGNRAEAERLYQKGADVLDALLSMVPTPETERLLLTEVGDLYSGYFELLSDEGRYDDAFRMIEEAHGRIETQELEFDHTAIPHLPAPVDLQLRQLELSLLKTERRSGRSVILQQIQELQSSDSRQPTSEKPVSLQRLREQLLPDELLVEYVLGSRHSHALAVSKSTVHCYPLPPKEELGKQVAEYRRRLEKYATDQSAGQILHHELLGFTNDYPAATALIIVADGDLHLLPFSALVDESGRYLIESKTVSMEPSGTVLHLLRTRAETTSASLPYLGVAPWTDAKPAKPWALRASSSNSGQQSLPALPESRDEVVSIAAMMPKPATLLLGTQATKKKFESLPLSDYRVLHLALHGLVDPVYPDKSALVFEPTSGDNGHLEARDIRQLHLRADLVTLSACDTAVGPIGAAGIESLDNAFIEAGADSVVSTLWGLEDRSSADFMRDFYKHLGNEDKADALRDAKLDLARGGAAPYYWASYELIGDPAGAHFVTR